MLWMSLLVVIFLAWHFAQIQKKETPLKFSEFMDQVEAGQIADVTISGTDIRGHTTSREPIETTVPPGYDKYVDALRGKQVVLKIVRAPDPARANIPLSVPSVLLLIRLRGRSMRPAATG